MPGVFPDYPAPVIRNTADGSELAMMRRGMPPPPHTGGLACHEYSQHLVPALAGQLKRESRCLPAKVVGVSNFK
jgi:hypothetical protein